MESPLPQILKLEVELTPTLKLIFKVDLEHLMFRVMCNQVLLPLTIFKAMFNQDLNRFQMFRSIMDSLTMFKSVMDNQITSKLTAQDPQSKLVKLILILNQYHKPIVNKILIGSVVELHRSILK